MVIVCSGCGDSLEATAFSKTQRALRARARCRFCVEKATHLPRGGSKAKPPAAPATAAPPPAAPATAAPPPAAPATAAPPPPPREALEASLAALDVGGGREAEAAAREEVEAVEAIFGDDFAVLPAPRGVAARFEVVLDRVALDVWCPPDYPSSSRPTFAVRVLRDCSEKARRALTALAAEAAEAAPEGEVCVFEVATAVREACEALDDAPEAAAEAPPDAAGAWTFEPACPQFGQRPVRFDADSGEAEHAVTIFDGEPVTDRRSTFQAFLAVGVDSLAKAHWALRTILARNKCGRATHNMRAYRFTDADGVRRADNDSDGEDGAGEKMAYLLDVLDADGVLVVVSRWYGGVHLGPDRFRHIAQCTQKILEAHGHGRRAAPAPAGAGTKKRR